MSFFKYPMFMRRKDKIDVLEGLIKHLNKKKICCPICKYKYRKGEQGKSYSIAKINDAKEYPADYTEGVCPVCKIEKDRDDEFLLIGKDTLAVINRIFIWRYKNKRRNSKLERSGGKDGE